MAIKVPALNRTAIISDDAILAAQLSCLLAQRNAYTAVLDGPRMSRDDRDHEITRRHNAIARLQPRRILLAGLSERSVAAMEASLPRRRCRRIGELHEAADLALTGNTADRPPLVWGRNRIGIGLLRALRESRSIEFTDEEAPDEAVPTISGHMVVCETGEELSEVIAANYAFSLGAGLCLVPAVPSEIAGALLERFYGLYDNADRPPADALEELCRQLKEHCPGVAAPAGGSMTFVTKKLPFGVAFPEVPTTHLYTYPDLGIAVVNGLAGEQPGTPGIGVAALVDPATTPAPEIGAAANILSQRRTFVRGYSDRGATVRAVSDMVHLFPYDFLMFATHCGDADGFRWTYRYTDREEIDRTLVVDIAIGIANTDDDDLLEVMQFERFHSLDGVDWSDPRKKDKLYVGDAIRCYVDRIQAKDGFEPVSKEEIGRVMGSAAMKMFDHNYIAIPHALANGRTPIVVNNACVSWHELSARFTFAGCRAYLGTLYPVMTSEAHDVVVKLLEKHFGKFLPHALWAAQRSVYGDGGRRPYVMTGVYVQRLRTMPGDVPAEILAELEQAYGHWQTRSADVAQLEPRVDQKKLKSLAEYYRREAAAFRARWFPRRQE
jgi:hypothetical protein